MHASHSLQMYHASNYHQAIVWLTQHVDGAFLQGITLGAIAFAIPALWSTVSEINGRITRHPEQHPLRILQNINYKRLQRSFISSIMIPSVALAFLGLVVWPLIAEPFSLILEAVVAGWFLSLLWLVKRAYAKHEMDLLQYVKSEDVSEDEYQNILSLVWGSTDVAVQDEYYTSVDEIFIEFYERLKAEVEAHNYEVVNNLYRPYIENLDKRTVLFSLKIKNLATKTLEFNYLAHKSHTDNDALDFVILDYTLEVSLRKLIDQYIKFNQSDDFFYFLEEHISGLLEDKDNGDYLDSLFLLYGELVLEKLAADKQGEALELRAFPQKWRITYAGLKDKGSQGTMVRTWNATFINWASSRIFNTKLEFDSALDRIFSYLYPELDPPTFANILTYTMNPYELAADRVNNLLNRKQSFGFGSHSFGGSFGIGEDALAKLEDTFRAQIKIQEQNVYDYFFKYYQINKNIQIKTVEDDIAELEKRLREENDDDLKRRINSWLNYLDGFKENYPTD